MRDHSVALLLTANVAASKRLMYLMAFRFDLLEVCVNHVGFARHSSEFTMQNTRNCTTSPRHIATVRKPQFDPNDSSQLYSVGCGILPKHCTDCCCGGTFDIIPTRSEKNSAQGQMIRSYDDLLHIYKCSFPNESNGNDKALILGASYLINELFFDKRFFPPSIGD